MQRLRTILPYAEAERAVNRVGFMKIKRIHILLVVLVLVVCTIVFGLGLRAFRGKTTVAETVARYGPAVRQRLAAEFQRIGAEYPPGKMILVGLKRERLLEVWVSDPPKLLKTYPILAASGTLGPKLREGDLQVPEGLYRIESLNPNSLYHLALRVDYPNEFDRAMGKRDGRDDLGCDIMIHGKDCSIGCLAMGDEAAEELFVLAAETGIDNVSVILSPVDFRIRELPAEMPEVPGWTPQLYASIKRELKKVEKVK